MITIKWNKSKDKEVVADFIFNKVRYQLYAGEENNLLYYKGFHFIMVNPNEVREPIFLDTLKRHQVSLDDLLDVVLDEFCKYINLPRSLFINNKTYKEIIYPQVTNVINAVTKKRSTRKKTGENNG